MEKAETGQIMKKILMVLTLLVAFMLTGCEKEESNQAKLSPFCFDDLLIDGHEALGTSPYWTMDWEDLKENSPAIENTYFDSFPGTPDMQLEYAESDGITYVISEDSIYSVLLTDDTYGLHAGIRVGDTMTQATIEQYHLKYFGKNTDDSNATLNTQPDRKCAQKIDYDSVFTTTTFISQEEKDSHELGVAVSFYVREGIITGISIERIV